MGLKIIPIPFGLGGMKKVSIDYIESKPLSELTAIARDIWNKGEMTKEISDIFDSIVDKRITKNEDKSDYKKWMIGRANFSSVAPQLNDFYDKWFPTIKYNTDIKILDIGARDGLSIIILESKGFNNVAGIEICESAIGRAPESIKYKIVIGDVHDMPYYPESFDLVLCRAVLEHCYDQEKAMKEMHRVLKPGGYLFVYIPIAIALSWNNCKRITMEKFTKWSHDIGFIMKYIDVKEIMTSNNSILNGHISGVLQKC